jgi:hypothetical protein
MKWPELFRNQPELLVSSRLHAKYFRPDGQLLFAKIVMDLAIEGWRAGRKFSPLVIHE